MNKLLVIILVGFSLTGCTTGARSVIPEEGMTMSDLYYQAIDNTTQPLSNKKPIKTDDLPDNKSLPTLHYTGYTRTAQNEIDSQFKPLPNPSIPLFVFPHLARMGDEFVPVPGYTTTFFLYKQNQYAMNTEVY